MTTYPAIEPDAYRWRQKGSQLWIYDPTSVFGSSRFIRPSAKGLRMPPLIEDVKACFRNHNRFAEVLGKIAHGRTDNGRPIAAETARQMARDVLVECGVNTWSPHATVTIGQR